MSYETFPSHQSTPDNRDNRNHNADVESYPAEREAGEATLFDEAVLAYFNVPLYGETSEAVVRTEEGKFLWDGNDVLMTITQDGVDLNGDDRGRDSGVERAERARDFALQVMNLWEKLPGAARIPQNLQALALAENLKRYE